MKLKGKRISFGLTSTFYAFKYTIKEMKNIMQEGAEIFPIMPPCTYKTDSKYYKSADFIKDIEAITKREIIKTKEEAEELETDIMVIAPCSRKPYCKNGSINI
ncbi:MAG: hypothetical protein K2H53_02925 [Clostridia bacterium]|nr:hypothetical protein [Clostridia bacterium]